MAATNTLPFLQTVSSSSPLRLSASISLRPLRVSSALVAPTVVQTPTVQGTAVLKAMAPRRPPTVAAEALTVVTVATASRDPTVATTEATVVSTKASVAATVQAHSGETTP